MKIYLASRYSRREEMLQVSKLLTELGHEVTSRWIHGSHEVPKDGLSVQYPTEFRQKFAAEDYEDLCRAEATINFTEEPRAKNSRGGRHVEFGASLAMGQKLFVVGPRENVFHCLPQVQAFDTLEELIASGELVPKLFESVLDP